jgi:hypothetical protein
MQDQLVSVCLPAFTLTFWFLGRTQPGQRQTVKNEEYYCHAHNRDGLVGIAFADGEYPARAGFGVVNKILDEFSDQSVNKWRSAAEDSTEALPILEPALLKFQVKNPAKRTVVEGPSLMRGGDLEGSVSHRERPKALAYQL